MDNGFYCLPHGVKNSSYEVETTFDGGGQPYKFKVNQCQNFYDPNDPQYGWNWHNRQSFWMELIAPANRTGHFSGTFVIKKNGMQSDPVPFSFDVEDHNGVALMFADSSASYYKQIEINEFVVNNSMNDLNLQDVYIDYYLKKSTNSKPQFDVWYSPGETCHEIYVCGNDEYIIRQWLRGEWNFPPNNTPVETAQIGYQENPPYYSPIYGDKLSGDGIMDYSYGVSVIDQKWTAYQRNAHISDRIVMRSSDGTVLLGVPPSDGSFSNCRLATYNVDYVSDSYDTHREYWCSENVATPEDVIYEGEDYFAMPELPNVEGVTFELVAADAASSVLVNKLEIGSPADYWTGDYDVNHNNNVNTAQNRKILYVRSKHGLIRSSNTIPPGTYKYRINIKSESTGSILNYIERTVVVKEGADHSKASGKNVAVLMGDETWFKKYQLDIASGLVNFSDQYVTLSNFHYDYYGRVDQKELINGATNLSRARYQPHYWYSHPGYDVSFTDCGSGYFRVRYSYSGQITIFPNHTAYDNKVGFVYATGYTMTKSDDYSMSYWPGEVSNRRRYSPYTPLYNNGQLIWGEEPSWAHSCDDGTPIVDPGSSGSGSGGSGSGGSGSGDPTSSASGTIVDVPQSSSSFDAFTDLAVRYMDNTNSYVSSDIPVLFDIVNKGTKDASLNGYTVRFYYNDTEHGDASKLSSIVYYSGDYQYNMRIFSDIHTQKCAEGKYAVDFKFSDLATVKAGDKYPHDHVQASLYQQSYTESFNKNNIHSWEDYKELTENRDIVLFDPNGNIVFGKPEWECNGYIEKKMKFKVEETISWNNSNDKTIGKVKLKVSNVGDLDHDKPLYVNFYVTHGNGQVPVIEFKNSNNKTTTIAVANKYGVFDNGVSVVRHSAGNKHTYLFTLPNGLKTGKSQSVEFKIFDACLNDCSAEDKSLFDWNFADDWSAQDGCDNLGHEVITNRVYITNDENEKLYGEPDPNAPAPSVAKVLLPGEPEPLKQPRAKIDDMRANRTDAVAYSGGQLLSGGDFEDEYLRGWTVSGTVANTEGEATSVRGASPQGSRYLELKANSKISQEISDLSLEVLRDSGATLTFWMNGGPVHVAWPGHDRFEENRQLGWVQHSVPLEKTDFQNNQTIALSFYTDANGVLIDDAVLVPGSAKPVTYATRFTNMANEEIESRAYDGDKEQLVTTSQRDEMGREWKKYLPYAMPCNGVVQCNSDISTMHNATLAEKYYIEKNTNYPDAKGFPYAETRWKPDPMATKDVVGNPGQAYSLDYFRTNGERHYTRVYSSGVNMDGVDPLNTAELSNAVSATNANPKQYSSPNPVNFDSENYHALADKNPTHLWELTIDPNGNKTFTVKDGEGLVIVSGALDANNNLASRTVNRYDANGNLTVVHPPMSCLYNPQPANCVDSTEYKYDSENHMIESKEPDAGITRTYYDESGRIRATQTQKQYDMHKATVSGYDNLDRVIYTGEWDVSSISDLRAFFKNNANKNKPEVSELTAGTISRMYYDAIPTNIGLGVKLYPDGINVTEEFKYSRGRLVATISDIDVTTNTYGAQEVIRTATSTVYDKYGNVLTTYTYDPTMPLVSLRMLAVKNTYDLGGKLTSSTKYPYGVDKARSVTERYNYDRLGRILSIDVQNDKSKYTELVSYSYNPTGTVKSLKLGNNVTIDYTYHISGAVKTASVKRVDGAHLYNEELSYEDCGGNGCTPQYNGNISRMTHELARTSRVDEKRDSRYYYDFMNRLTKVDDTDALYDEAIAYDDQGRIASMRRAARAEDINENANAGVYTYKNKTNQLVSVSAGIGGGDFTFLGDATKESDRDMSNPANFVYDSDGNLTEDKSKGLTISYDWRGMPVEFVRTKGLDKKFKLSMMYDGSGKRLSKTVWTMGEGGDWEKVSVTHYSGIGTEVRELFHNDELDKVKVVMSMPQGLGRYGVEEITDSYTPRSADDNANASFEWYLKNHIGSTMLVFGTYSVEEEGKADLGIQKAAYDYRAFGEQMSMLEVDDKVTENFTGKELDDEIALNYFGARYLDPMLGLWISVDNARQFASPYTYAGNNPVTLIDNDGNIAQMALGAAVGVASGFGIAIAKMMLTGEDFHYGRNEMILDAACGALGLGLIKQAKKIGELKKIYDIKKAGKVVSKGNKWDRTIKESKAAAESGALTASGIVVGKYAINGALDDAFPDKREPNPGHTLDFGEKDGASTPSDNTNVQIEIDK